MNERQTVIYREVMEACDAILAATKGMNTNVVNAALTISLIVVAHDENRYEHELLMRISRVINNGWAIFNRANVMEGIRRLRIRNIRRAN
jgi:hypothetical protein